MSGRSFTDVFALFQPDESRLCNGNTGGLPLAQPTGVGVLVTFGYWPRWAVVVSVTLGLFALLSIAACRQGVPVIDTSPAPARRTGPSAAPSGVRRTSAIEVARWKWSTCKPVSASAPRPTTRVVSASNFVGEIPRQAAARDGESIIKQPGVIDLNKSDVDAHADFVLGSVRVSRPRSPQYRDDGLGSPIA